MNIGVNMGCDYMMLSLWSRMETVGIRDLKARLSRHLKRVRAGVRLAVTERGRIIATINPVEPPANVDWAHQLVTEGHAHWNGGKPTGAAHPPKLSRKTAASIVLEDRR
jgi:antitoxin (DNA-binding transcriptional repressor) of toxin-antitoxin stability system